MLKLLHHRFVPILLLGPVIPSGVRTGVACNKGQVSSCAAESACLETSVQILTSVSALLRSDIRGEVDAQLTAPGTDGAMWQVCVRDVLQSFFVPPLESFYSMYLTYLLSVSL